MEYDRVLAHLDRSSDNLLGTLILDNFHVLCPHISQDGPPNLVETVKSEKFVMIIKEILKSDFAPKIICIARHYS